MGGKLLRLCLCVPAENVPYLFWVSQFCNEAPLLMNPIKLERRDGLPVNLLIFPLGGGTIWCHSGTPDKPQIVPGHEKQYIYIYLKKEQFSQCVWWCVFLKWKLTRFSKAECMQAGWVWRLAQRSRPVNNQGGDYRKSFWAVALKRWFSWAGSSYFCSAEEPGSSAVW